MTRRLIRTAARALLEQDWLGETLAAWSGPSGWLGIQRQAALEVRFTRRATRFFADRTVRSGPFAGLNYAATEAHGSALWPKLLGTYESELHPILADLRNRHYDDVVDIGFAEGYYLIGLAKWFNSARIWGFDPSPEAHRLCTSLAAANALPRARLRLAGAAVDGLLAPALTSRSMVICDCEGCEAELFSLPHLGLWRNSDIIIECHDDAEPGLTETLRENLSRTHRVRSIPSLSPAEKLPQLDAQSYRCFSEDEKLMLLSEGRPSTQKWLFAQPLA